MTAWVLFALLLTFVILRASRVPEARLTSGIALMAFGIWLIWSVALNERFYHPFHHAPDLLPLLFGLWLVVKGALRFASY